MKNMPRLRNLVVAGVGIGDAGAVALATTPWIAQLRKLDLSSTYIEEAGCQAILDSPYLDQVELLDLRYNLDPMPPELKVRLFERFRYRVIL